MSVKPNKKPSFALGLILILLLLAAVILGGSWVVRQAFLPRQSDARPAAAAVSGQPAAAAQLPVQTAEETVSGAQPEAVPEPAAEPEPEPARVTLMAVGDDLIHNCVYWSAQTPRAAMTSHRSSTISAPPSSSMIWPASIRRPFWSRIDR